MCFYITWLATRCWARELRSAAVDKHVYYRPTLNTALVHPVTHSSGGRREAKLTLIHLTRKSSRNFRTNPTYIITNQRYRQTDRYTTRHDTKTALENWQKLSVYAVITIAIRLWHDCDTTTIRLRRIARACFQFDASKNEHVNFSS